MKKLLLFFLALCATNLTFSQCNIVYVSTSGTPSGSGDISDPMDLETAVSTASAGDLIRVGVGTYTIDEALTIPADDVILEGGYDDFNAWQRTSLAGATTINRSSLNAEGFPNEKRLVAIYANGISGFEIHDITITTGNGAENGTSTYGIHIQSCANYRIVRCQVVPGNGADGEMGVDGQPGVPGSVGGQGLAGSIDGNCSGGAGGAGGAGGGGTPGVVGGTNPAGCDNTGGSGPSGNASTNSRNGGSGGGGGSGGETDNNGGSGGPGGGINGGAAQLGGGSAGAWGDPGGDGTPGSNGDNGLPGVVGNLGINGQLNIFFDPGVQAPSGSDGMGGKGGVGGGGGGGQSCGFCDDGSGDGGGGGGGGGQGGVGGTGGKGGGGSFGIYIFNNGLNGEITDCNIQPGFAGSGGIGGDGGSGGTGGIGADGSTYGSAEVGTGGKGGNGGQGGDGGKGGDGAAGYSLALHIVSGSSLNVADSLFDLAGQPEITVDYVTCVGEYTSAKDQTLPVGSGNALWDFGSSASSQFSTSNPASTSFNSTGMFSVAQSGNSYTDFVHITCEVDAGASQNGTLLTANTGGATYQWVDCNIGFFPVSGATSQSFTPSVTGDYAVVVTQNGCTDTSACFNVDYSGLFELANGGFRLYPNPLSDWMKIELTGSQGKVNCRIFNTAGLIVDEFEANGQNNFAYQFKHPKGVYLVEITNSSGKYVERVIKL